MEAKEVADSVKAYLKTKNTNDINETIRLMQPLVKKYSSKLYYLEYDDCCQELNIAIYEAVTHIRYIESNEACTKYIAQCVKNKFVKLYKLSKQYEDEIKRKVELENSEISSEDTHLLDLIYLIDLSNKIQGTEKKEKIIYLLLYGYTDREIASKLNVSRQYINRIKKNIIKNQNNI